ncbi:MAG TPA: urease accessory UreF family protein [Lichenihabitans sp.]|nr:urease accessory UreF family protein [Lichenihabitans sp.]
MTMDTAISTTIDPVLPLLAWLSPAYPVGAFAYSHGLESALDAGLVTDASALERWIGDLVRHGSVRQDAVLAAAAFRATGGEDTEPLAELNDLALALAPSRERRLETASTGRAFVEVTRAAWPQAIAPGLPAEGDVAYPIAFGSAAGRLRLPLVSSLAAFVLGVVSNLVSAALRLGAVGQTDAQRIVAAQVGPAEGLGAWASQTTLDDLGGCALRSDIASLHHETLYSRLFRS